MSLIAINCLSSSLLAKDTIKNTNKYTQKKPIDFQQLKNIKLHNTQLALEEKVQIQRKIKEKKLNYEKQLTKMLKK